MCLSLQQFPWIDAEELAAKDGGRTGQVGQKVPMSCCCSLCSYLSVYPCVCVCACVRACVRACVCACVCL